MTTYVEARDAIVAHANQWTLVYPGVPVFYENTVSVDLDSVGDYFLKVDIDFQDAVQMDLDLGDIGRLHTGEVQLTLFYKAGTGVRTTLASVDYLTTHWTAKNLSGVITGVPRPGSNPEKGGWVSQEILVPFEFSNKAIS